VHDDVEAVEPSARVRDRREALRDVPRLECHVVVVRRVRRPAVEARGAPQRPRRVAADPDRQPLLDGPWRERDAVDRLAVPPAPEQVEARVEALRASVLAGLLAERGELALVAAETGAEDDAAAR
jgi:hypothetical protein